MKTTMKNESKRNRGTNGNQSLGRTSSWVKGATLGCIAVLTFINVAGARGPKRTGPCDRTAQFVYYSDLQAANSEYNLALAKANNEPTSEERRAARIQAREDYRDALGEAKDQFRARRDLCHALDEDRYNPAINPADFLRVSEIVANPNPLNPLIPGTIMNYRAETDEGIETTRIVVTRETREILGVTCIVVRDTVRLEGEVTEDTVDWFAQDRHGNVWYFGENTAEYEGGLITSIAGAWEAGVNGAEAGIVMFAQPMIGQVYRQELLYGEAEDAAEVISLTENVTVPAGSYTSCLQTKEYTPIEPDVFEFKYYATGVGNILTVNPETGIRSELVSIETE